MTTKPPLPPNPVPSTFFANKPIPFGAKMGWRVTDEGERSTLFAHLAERYQLQVLQRSERQVRTLHHPDLAILQKFRHLVSLHYDLPLTLLYCTNWPTGDGASTPVAFFIERGPQPQITAVRYGFDPEVYQETVFEGELLPLGNHSIIASQGTPLDRSGTLVVGTFLISDILVHQGAVLDHSLTYRLGLLQGLLGHRYRPDPITDPYQLTYKPAVEYHVMKDYFLTAQNPTNNPHAKLLKGLVFRPQNRFAKLWVLPLRGSPQLLERENAAWPDPPPPDDDFPAWSYQPVAGNGRVTEVPKYSGPPLDPNALHTFFVVAGHKPDVYDLFVVTPATIDTPERLQRLGRAAITTMENSLALQMAFEAAGDRQQLLSKEQFKGLLLPARYVERFKRWEPAGMPPGNNELKTTSQ